MFSMPYPHHAACQRTQSSCCLPKSLLLGNTLHNAAIKKLREAAGLSLRAELCCRPAKRAAAQIAHILATTGILSLQWKQTSLPHKPQSGFTLTCCSLSSPVLANHWTYSRQCAGLYKLRKNVIPSLCYE